MDKQENVQNEQTISPSMVEETEVIDLTRGQGETLQDISEPSTISEDEQRIFIEAFVEMVVEASGEWIEDHAERTKYQTRLRKLLPVLLMMWRVEDAFEAVEAFHDLPKPVRLLGCLATVGGVVFTLHPNGLRAQMEKRRAS